MEKHNMIAMKLISCHTCICMKSHSFLGAYMKGTQGLEGQ